MSLTFYLKKNLNRLPIGIEVGKIISKVPYQVRPGIGLAYLKVQKDIKLLKRGPKTRKEFILNKVRDLTQHAYENTQFYKTYYDEMDFNPYRLKCFEDLQKIPITNKALFQRWSLEDRSTAVKGLAKSNTGGSTGEPLSFYTDSKAIGNEWAHLHEIWGRLGYSPSSLKLIFAGRSNVQDGLQYDLLRHSLVVDIYKDFEEIKPKLLPYLKKNKIQFLHGYPSALYEFSLFCEQNGNEELRRILQNSLKGVFLNSEYPYKEFRETIESVFDVKTLSFYGHTERCIMAFEDYEKFNFQVLQSYGYSEVVDNNLIGTSYYSYGTPLIRYNTEDKVDKYEYKNGFLETFSLKEGRKGDFVIDKDGKKITLTGLIFGRHHDLFSYCNYLQVKQDIQGEVKVYYVTKNPITPIQARTMFDSKNVNINFNFERVNTPFKTPSGKVNLRIH